MVQLGQWSSTSSEAKFRDQILFRIDHQRLILKNVMNLSQENPCLFYWPIQPHEWIMIKPLKKEQNPIQNGKKKEIGVTAKFLTNLSSSILSKITACLVMDHDEVIPDLSLKMGGRKHFQHLLRSNCLDLQILQSKNCSGHEYVIYILLNLYSSVSIQVILIYLNLRRKFRVV